MMLLRSQSIFVRLTLKLLFMLFYLLLFYLQTFLSSLLKIFLSHRGMFSSCSLIRPSDAGPLRGGPCGYVPLSPSLFCHCWLIKKGCSKWSSAFQMCSSTIWHCNTDAACFKEGHVVRRKDVIQHLCFKFNRCRN